MVLFFLLVGFAIKYLDNPTKDQLFDDDAFWEVSCILYQIPSMRFSNGIIDDKLEKHHIQGYM